MALHPRLGLSLSLSLPPPVEPDLAKGGHRPSGDFPEVFSMEVSSPDQSIGILLEMPSGKLVVLMMLIGLCLVVSGVLAVQQQAGQMW